MSSTTGAKFKVTVFGESHADFIGCTIEGLPKGIKLDTEKILDFMKRRAPGNSDLSTTRKESDIPQITTGVTDGVTNGDVLTAVIQNNDVKSADYSDNQYLPRPSHADYPAYVKYGKIPSGGGAFSGRMTAPLCFAGALAMQILLEKGVKIKAHILSIHNIKDDPFNPINLQELSNASLPLINANVAEEMHNCILEAKSRGDSVGGSIECAVTGLPVGIGDALFDGIESKLSANIFAIPAVKAIEFGLGFNSEQLFGSEFNDPYTVSNGKVVTKTNNNGGITGGMSNGMPLIFRVAIKPTPSIKIPQKTVNLQTLSEAEIVIKGRHDPCIVPRAVPVVEAVAAITILDMML